MYIKLNTREYSLITNIFLRVLFLLLASQLLIVESFAQDDYLSALSKVDKDQSVTSDKPAAVLESILTNNDDRAEFESQLFRTSSRMYNYYLEIERSKQKAVITIYTSKKNMKSAIEKLIEFIGREKWEEFSPNELVLNEK